jgi:catechol 2,3-dioxygenase-like lactoylglutathione lyase family enzyme
MLKVPSVDDCVDFWTNDIGGKVRISRFDENQSNGESKLLSAFVELGYSRESKDRHDGTTEDESTSSTCFALELVRTDLNDYSIGNVISYIGVSMLLQFQSNLLGIITGEEKPKKQCDDPNGIPVKSSASAPGDFLSRLTLKSSNLESTYDFYTTLLGMDCKAQDDNMICLRYDNDCFQSGVPTTLVFESVPTNTTLDPGQCFDHLAVATTASIQRVYDKLHQQTDYKIFMKPTEMFGKQVMGLIDPNGYKVVLAGQ